MLLATCLPRPSGVSPPNFHCDGLGSFIIVGIVFLRKDAGRFGAVGGNRELRARGHDCGRASTAIDEVDPTGRVLPCKAFMQVNCLPSASCQYLNVEPLNPSCQALFWVPQQKSR